MNIVSYMKREKSGLAFTTLELVKAAQNQGHSVSLREPTDDQGLPGKVLYGTPDLKADVETIHSQMPLTSYFNGVPKFFWCHGEPLSSVGNGVSMKALVGLAPKMNAFIAMRQEEYAYWSSICKTYVVPKGIDLERFHPVEVKPHDPNDPTSMLEGEPAVLYCEHWRGQRNPLPICVAMEKVFTRNPKAKLHLFNCTDARMHETFKALIQQTKWWAFIRSFKGPVADGEVNLLYNRAHIVVSALFPLYARSIEAFGSGRAFLGAGYTDPEYPFHCTLDPDSIAMAICDIWENYDKVNFRKWAEQKHDVNETMRQATAIYQRYL